MGSEMSAPFFTYTWRIENFAYCFQNVEEQLLSPIFEFDTSSKWQLRIYPFGKIPQYQNWTSVYLVKCEGKNDTTLTWGCGIILTDGESQQIHNVENKFDKDTLSWGCDEFFRRCDLFEKKDLYLQGGTLVIQCVIQKIEFKNKPPIFCPGISEIGNERMGFTRIETKSFTQTCYKNLTEQTISCLVLESNEATWFSVDIFFTSTEDVLVEIRKKVWLRSFYTTCEILIYESSGRMQHAGNYEHLFIEPENNTWTINFIPINYDSLRQKHITIKLKFTVSTAITRSYTCTVGKEDGLLNVLDDRSLFTEFKKDILEMYTNQISCDFKLNSSDGKEFRVHKAILQARSPVFKSMLDHDTKERQENQVDIVDVDSETMVHVLKYIYSSDIEDVNGHVAIKVYAAADKYHLPTLKQHCNRLIRSKMNCTIVFKALKFAELHNDLLLKKNAMDFLCRHGYEAFKSEEWSELTTYDAQLSSEILLYAMRRVKFKQNT